MDYTNLIIALIGALPGLVTAIGNFFANNPKLAGETDEQYAARITAGALAMAKDTTAANQQVME